MKSRATKLYIQCLFIVYLFLFFYVLRFLYFWNQFFRFWIFQKKIYQNFIKDSTSDSLEFIWFHISIESNSRTKFSNLYTFLKNSKQVKLIEKISKEIIKKIYELKKFHTFDYFWTLKILRPKILQMLKIITTMNKESKRSTKNKKTKTFFKKSSKYSSKWTIDKFAMNKIVEEFWKEITTFKQSKKNKFFSSKKNINIKKSSFFELFTSFSKKRNQKKKISASIKNRQQRSSFWTEVSIFLKFSKANSKRLFINFEKKKHTILRKFRDI